MHEDLNQNARKREPEKAPFFPVHLETDDSVFKEAQMPCTSSDVTSNLEQIAPTDDRKVLLQPENFDEPLSIKKPLLSSLLETLNDRFNPVRVYQRMSEYVSHFKNRNSIKEDQIYGDIRIANKLLSARSYGCLGAGEIVGWSGFIAASAATQYLTGDAKLTVIAGIAMNYIPAIATFDTLWYQLNKNYYRSQFDSSADRLKALAKDVLILHCQGLALFFPLSALSGYATAKLIPNADIPIAPVAYIVEGLVVALPYALSIGRLALFRNKFRPKFMSYLVEKYKDDSSSS